jgi:hypothetical protein
MNHRDMAPESRKDVYFILCLLIAIAAGVWFLLPTVIS